MMKMRKTMKMLTVKGQTLKKRTIPIFCRPQDRGECVELRWERAGILDFA
jgi:hypothetical protein